MEEIIRGKKLLILGGMILSCEIIQKAKSLGIFTIVADYNPIENSPGKVIADKYFDIDITNIDAVVDLIKLEKIDGVIVGYNDMLLPYYAEICKKSGLPCYGTKEQFDILTDKKKYKKLCKRFDIPTIQEFDLDDPNIDFPVIIKPVDNSGSRGIIKCKDRLELNNSVEIAKLSSSKGGIIIEKYMEGKEVTVFWTFQRGKYYLSGIANRHIKQTQGYDIMPLPVGYTFPSIFQVKYRAEVENKCKKMFKHLGIKDGMMFMQCKIEDDTCFVYDIGFRLTGSLEYKIISEICEYNPLEMMIIFALTGKMGFSEISSKAIPEFKRKAFNISCLCSPGRIMDIEGLDEIKSFPEVIDTVIAHFPGETISEEMKGLLSQVTVRILGVVDNVDDLFHVMNKINSTIKIICDDGENHLLPGIEEMDIKGYIL